MSRKKCHRLTAQAQLDSTMSAILTGIPQKVESPLLCNNARKSAF